MKVCAREILHEMTGKIESRRVNTRKKRDRECKRECKRERVSARKIER